MKTRTLGATVLVLTFAASLSAQSVKPSSIATAKGVIRPVTVSESEVLEITTRAGFTTLLMFPDGEDIVHLAMGDATLWTPQQNTPNTIAIKPTLDGIETNMHLTTISGKTYSAFIRERKNVPPDMKVMLETGFTTKAASQKYFTAAEVEPLKAELATAYARMDAIQKEADQAIADAQAKVPSTLAYYEVKNIPPFKVQGMVSNGAVTFIKVAGREAPVLYELIDDKPSMVNVQVLNGDTYVASKVLGPGYFVLGKQRLAFRPAAQGN